MTPIITKHHNNYFIELPNEFTKEDLVNIINRHNGITKPTLAIHLWKKSGLVEKVGRGKYRKLPIRRTLSKE